MFGKYNPANKYAEGTAIEHVQKITLYSRLIEEVKWKFTINKTGEEQMTIIKLTVLLS